jgi:hypothetical protein
MMSKVKQMIASKFAARGQVVILDTSIRKFHPKTSSSSHPLIHEFSSSEDSSAKHIKYLTVPVET